MAKKTDGNKSRNVRKYEFEPGDGTVVDGHIVRRIRAKSDIPGTEVKAGTVGGCIESESNLSHNGTCWVYDNAVVRGRAHVVGDAKVAGNAVVCGGAMVRDRAVVCDGAIVNGRATIRDDASVSGNASVSGCAEVGGHAKVADAGIVDGDAKISGWACVHEGRVEGSASVTDNAVVCMGGCVSGSARVGGRVTVIGVVGDKASVFGHLTVQKGVVLSGDAEVDDSRGYIAFYLSWTNDTVVFIRSNGHWRAWGYNFATTKDMLLYCHLLSERAGREAEACAETVKRLGCVDDMFPDNGVVYFTDEQTGGPASPL